MAAGGEAGEHGVPPSGAMLFVRRFDERAVKGRGLELLTEAAAISGEQRAALG